jgi:hypothetical protein
VFTPAPQHNRPPLSALLPLESQIHVNVVIREHLGVPCLQLKSRGTRRNLEDSFSLLGNARVNSLKEYPPLVWYIEDRVGARPALPSFAIYKG